jgi:FtsH-binding integral membrane protein
MFRPSEAQQPQQFAMESPPFKGNYDHIEEGHTPPPKDHKIDLGSPDQGSSGASEGPSGPSNMGVHVNLRNAFIRRVYGILSAQLILTVAICCFCALYQPMTETVLGYPRTFMYGSMIPSLVLIIALHFMKNSHPWNVVLLGLFTVCESLMIGVLAAAYKTAGMTDVLLSAAGLTLGIFLCLTAFVFISKKDFSFMGGFLFAGLFIMIGWGLLNLIFGWRVHFLYSACGALLFVGFILYDTSNILRNLSYDDYIIGAIQLYLDILNLFLYILQLLSSRK